MLLFYKYYYLDVNELTSRILHINRIMHFERARFYEKSVAYTQFLSIYRYIYIPNLDKNL